MKRSIVYSQVFDEKHTFFPLLREISGSFGYETVVTDSIEKMGKYLRESDYAVVFCDDVFLSQNLLAKIKEIDSVRDRISLVLLNADESNPSPLNDAVDSFLFLWLPQGFFEQSVFFIFKYVGLKEKLSCTSRVKDPEFIKKLLSDTAHAINNILTGMQGYAELAQLNPHDRQLIRDSFQVVVDSSYRVRSEIKNLRAFARVENPVIRPIRISSILKDSLELAKNQIRAKKIKICENIGGEFSIRGDYDQLVQVFFNLLSDIIHHSDQEAAVSIGLSTEGEEGLFSIMGEGCALEKTSFRSLQRLFAFHRVVFKNDSGEGRIESGNVLSLCNRIIYNHGGSIQLERMGDRRLTYTVRMPVLRVEGEEVRADTTTVELTHRDIPNLDMDILIVDDEEYVRNTMYYYFNKKGCRVTVAEDGIYGLDLARKHPFDLIFMDYLMPKMGGVEAAKKILQQNRDAKIVFITGRESLSEEELYTSGIYACIRKPFEMKDLFDIALKVALQKGIV